MCEPVTLGVLAGAAAGTGAATVGGMGFGLGAASVGLGAASTAMSAASAYQSSRIQQQVANNNAAMADYEAAAAERRGQEEAARIRRAADQTKGLQRNVLAGRGVDLTSGTAAEIQDQTDFFGQLDAIQARENAATEAWGLRFQSASTRAAARTQSPTRAAVTSLISGGGTVADRWYRFQR